MNKEKEDAVKREIKTPLRGTQPAKKTAIKKDVKGGKKGLSLKYKIALLSSSIIFLVMSLMTVISLDREITTKKVDADLRMAGIMTMIRLGMTLMPHNQLEELVNSLYKIGYNTKKYNLDLVYVLIEEPEDTYILNSINPKVRKEDGSKTESIDPITLKDSRVKDLRKIEMPIKDSGTGNIKGVINVGYYLLDLNQGIGEMVMESIAVTIIFIVLALLMSILLANRLTRPIKDLVSGMESVSEGDFQRKVEVTTSDEIGFLATSFNQMTDGLREREFIRDTFKRYVTREIADKLLSQKDDVILTGEKRMVTVLFADIKGFTPMAENTPPVELVNTLNDFFSVMIDVIFKYEGILDKFIGDAIMAFWNAPLEQNQPALKAVTAALHMQKGLMGLNKRRVDRGKFPISMGIGINTGEAVAGVIGSEKKMEYTIIGDTVNVAQRLESVTEPGQVLVSESTYMLTGGRLSANELPAKPLKGIKRPIKIFNVMGIKKS